MPDSNPDPDIIERPCPFVTFYSFKGGVGRSMAVINVAGIMASRGFRILVIDMDLEAPGLSFLANPAPTEEDQPRLSQPGFVDFMLDAVERGADGDLFQLSAADAVRCYSTPYELPTEFRRSPEGSLHIMPVGRIDDGYPRRLNRLDLPALYQDGLGLALIKAFKQVVQDSKLFDYIFVDSRTGFSDESGICTRDLADCLMVVSGLNKQNVEGTTRFLSALRQATEEKKPLEVILSPIPNGEDALVDEREKRAQAAFSEAWGVPIKTELHIPYHPQLALTEEPHIFRRRRGYLFEAYNKIERNILNLLGDTLAGVLGLATAALRDKDFAEAAAHFQKFRKLAEPGGLYNIGLLFSDITWIADPEAEALFDQVADHTNSTSRELLGRLIASEALRQERTAPDIAKALYERALVTLPQDATILGQYVRFLIKDRADLDSAEAIYKRALEASPENALVLGSYAYFLWKQRKDVESAETKYKQALKADPKQANNLGAYANLLWRERKNTETAKALYRQALDLDPNHANTLGSYASMLWEERIDIDAAEALFEQAIAADPRHAFNLGRLAQFLWRERGKIDAAATMFNRAIEADPKQLSNLGSYATFLWEEQREVVAAEAIFKRALDVDPDDASILGNYAYFLWAERNDVDAAEAMFKQALDAAPDRVSILGDYASFLWNAKANPILAEEMYKRAIAAAPMNASILCNYAIFLSRKREDPVEPDIIEEAFKQALRAAPNMGLLLSNYALFLWLRRKNLNEAEIAFKDALAADANDSYCLGNYGGFCIETGRVSEGIELVDRALTIQASNSSREPLDAELCMYVFCCGAPGRRRDALQQLRTLIQVQSILTGDWDFSGVVEQARAMSHPEASWLPPLADVLAGRRPPTALDDWPAWREAAPQ